MTTEILPDPADPHPAGSRQGPRYDLNESTWLVRGCRHRAGLDLAQEVSRTGSSPAGWLPARVPGLVTADLLRAGRVADPYFDDSPRGAREVEERDFVYLRRVILRPEDLEDCPRARLVFDSLDTFATVFVNGKRVAHHENQFRRLFVDVTDALHSGENWIAVAFEASWPATLRRAGPELPHANGPGERLYVRKAQAGFGWDGSPRIPSVGMVGPAHLELSRGLFADDLWLTGQPIGEAGGSISAQAEYTPHDSFEAEVALLIEGEERLREHVTFHAGHAHGLALADTLPQVRRWAPHDRGEPTLYHVELRVTRDGEILHTLQGRVGIRSVELDVGSAGSRCFRLLVNGEPCFVQGETWIPMDLLHARTTDAELQTYLELLVQCGVNLVRVWGGGIVERRAFYEACDELGLLVWQDFPYAHGVYPAHDDFLEEARSEAEDIVRRLRRHTCLALWCGNDECELVAERFAPELRHHPLHYEVLRDVTSRLDPHRPYWPGSPASLSPEEPANSPREGDRHDRDVWSDWQDSDGAPDQASFCSALGAQSLPQRETLETCLPLDAPRAPGAGTPLDPALISLLARRGAQLEKLLARCSEYAYPRDLDTFIATTQAFQADTIGRRLRHYRRLQAGGVILRTATSGWPSTCWGLIDGYRRPKQAFYAARRAFAPVVMGIEPTDASRNRYAVHVSATRAETLDGAVELSLRHLASGDAIQTERAPIRLLGHAAAEVVTLSLPSGCDRTGHALVATLRYTSEEGHERELREVAYLEAHRHLQRGVDHGSTGKGSMARENASLRAIWWNEGVQLVSKAWHVRVGLESYESPVIWDDNYIDLLPGEERFLRVVQGQPEHLWLVANFGQRVPLPRNVHVRL